MKILAQKVTRGPRHDSKDAIPTIRKTSKYKPVGFSLDKAFENHGFSMPENQGFSTAFDEEEIHRVINEELGATSMIPLKKGAKKGKYRLAMQSLFSKPKYHLRSLVETVISVRKRIFGDSNTSRSDRLRNKETKLKNGCYNIYCYVKRLSFTN
ncbi:MAG: hypothetical protein PQ965_07255 [Methanobacteriaceae archaeon]